MIIQSLFCPHPTLLALEGSNIFFYVCLGGASELSNSTAVLISCIANREEAQGKGKRSRALLPLSSSPPQPHLCPLANPDERNYFCRAEEVSSDLSSSLFLEPQPV
ncbi:hypothetical protein ASPCAL07327 [Aspergillus calidoustus]|uniref:Uncharacterized protein n=1 Tax=Aspergillus calidoustus TaxID=454130 RepID=A0A0U5CAJ3_ASPCI|nr:hypothetical protein ASPCAL07327 [Aspergillus calidoustus]